MNSHNPFNTGGSGCTNDFRSADQLVDRIIGDAYHVVKEVYLALGNLTYIYNYLQKYGLIITVDSEDAIKDIPLSIGKFARVYSKSDTVGYYFTDYLYVENDTTGIPSNDPTATGSWVSTKATGSNASFVRIWKYHAVADGETVIQLPTDIPIVSVQTIYVQGIRQDVGEGFTYNEGDATLTLADELDAGNLVTVIIGISDPDMDIDIFEVLKNTDGASNIGTMTGDTVEERLTSLDSSLNSLGSGEGLKLVGRCASLSALRLIEPGVDGQWIVLEKAISNGQIINEVLTYDASDVTSADNGYSVFVTAGGKRWKADLTNGYNPLFLLGAFGYESISSCINKIAYDLAVLWGNKKGVIDYCTTIRIPGKTRGETRYSVTGAIHLPSFVTLKMDVDTYFDYYTVTNTDGIIIDNSYFPMLLDSAYDTSSTARPRSVLLWESERDIFTGGRLTLTHPIGSARTSNAGITIGNTVTGFIDVRGCRVRNFESLGFYYGIKINPIDNYINTFDGFHLGRNNYAVAVLGDTKNNAGERFLFRDGTLADSDSDLIYVENNAFELFFHGCSLDYPTGDLVKITKNGNTYISFNQCHIEGVQGMLVNVTASTTFPKYGKKIVFSNSILDLGSGQVAPALWNKTWAFSSVINTYLLIEKSCRVWTSTSTMSHAKTAYQSLIVSGQPANNAIVIDFPQNIEDLLDASTVLLGKFNPTGEDKRVISTNRFSGTDGAAYSPSVSAADQWGWYAVNGAWTYSPADTSDNDGLQSISLTSDNASNVYYLICALPYSVMSQEKFRALGAIKVASGYTGNVNVSCLVEARSLLTMNSSAVSETTLATTYSPAVDVAAIAEANGRIDKFQGFCTQAGQVNSFSNSAHPMQYVRVGLRITGFTGTISLKLPTVTSHRLLGS